MNASLQMFASEAGCAIVVVEQARWHVSGTLVVPEWMAILLPPLYSPELDPIEHLSGHLRSDHMSSRACDDCKHLLVAGAGA